MTGSYKPPIKRKYTTDNKDTCNNLFIEHLEYRTEEDADVKPYVNLTGTRRKISLEHKGVKERPEVVTAPAKRLTGRIVSWTSRKHVHRDT